MSEAFYKTVRLLGGAIFRIASAPIVLHRERADRPGAYILAANHGSAFDAPLLIVTTPRVIYWLSIVELFRHPLLRWFLTGMRAAPLDRSKADSATMRVMLRHLRAGRVIGIFPEGRMRTEEESVLHGGEIRDGICKLAQLASVPVLPCVVSGSENFRDWKSWLPLARTRFAVAYGKVIFARADLAKTEARAAMAEEIQRAFRDLNEEIQRCA